MKESRKNYMDALIHISQVGNFEAKQVEHKYKISNTFITVCCELGLVKRDGTSKLYKWCADREPQYNDVTLIKKNLRSRYLLHVQNKRNKQLTIKPIKRVERPQPVAVQHDEPFYDNSNSKVMLILAVGAVLGFMIATLIWK
jgi:hypothetical protein